MNAIDVPAETQPSQAVVKSSESVKSLLANASYKKRFEEVLGKRAPQFMASISNAAQTPGLARCEPKSVLAAAFVAATLDLPIDRNLGLAWLIPYQTNVKNGAEWKRVQICQFQMGYKGFVNLAMRSGQYHRLNAFVVNKEAVVGYDDCGETEIEFKNLDSTKAAVGYAVVWRLSNGFRKLVYWTKDEVLSHAARYSQGFKQKSKDSPWVKNFDQMALKTVVKNALAKWGILSVEMRDAIKHDAGSQVDIDAEVTPAELIESEAIDAETVEDLASAPTEATGNTQFVNAEGSSAQPSPTGLGEQLSKPGAAPSFTPQQHLEHLIEKDLGHSFDTFRKWGESSGNVPDAMSLPDWAAVPTAIAERLIKSKKVALKEALDRV
jgi:recombination protein RecT